MMEVVALTTGADADGQVMQTAAMAGEIIRADVRRVSLAQGTPAGPAAARLLRALREPGAVLGVLASEQPSRSFWQRIVSSCAKPVIVVPPAARGQRPGIRRVLLPLDGTPESARAVAEAVGQFATAGVDLVALHVFNEATVPMFWDQPAHAHRAWAEEFLARNCVRSGARLELRTGVTGEHIVDVAARERADMIVLGWSRQLDPGRARTVRHTVLSAAVPILLVPLVVPQKDIGPFDAGDTGDAVST
jgi:nucleotide-binding universal stress UspA family protein